MAGRQPSPPQPSCFWFPRRFNMASKTPRLGGQTRTELPSQSQAQTRSSTSTASASLPQQDVARRSTRPIPIASSQLKPGDQRSKQPSRSQEEENLSPATSRKTGLQTPLGPQMNPRAPTLTGMSSRTKSHGSSAPPRIQPQLRLQVSTPASQPKSPAIEASLVKQEKLLAEEPKQSKMIANEKLPAEISSLGQSKSYRETEESQLNGPELNQANIPNTMQGTEEEEQVENKQLNSASEATQRTRKPAINEENDKEQNDNCSTGKERKIVVSTMPQTSFFDGDRATFGKEINEGLSRLGQQISIGRPEQQAVNIITFAGKSKGASMAIGHEPAKYRGDGIASIINNNVETINNSAFHESTCRVRDPGVHLDIVAKHPKIVNTKAEAVAPKVERAGTNRTPDQTLNQGPRVRRRCLRALFMESSDSDPENPQKPQRHGCRYSCDDKKKSKGHDGRTSTTETMREQRKEGTNRA